MQQQGGGGGTQSHYGAVVSSAAEAGTTSAAAPSMAAEAADQAHVVEEASPISSRPPAGGAISAVNLDELMTLSGAAADVAADQGGGGSGGNRWPRQETLALLKIRSEMDVAFRDATLKGPLWEDVSRKLAELGYKRNAKKCKEKFENVHKYYKRTKEGRAGRQDGKSYKFFSELEALHGSPNVSASPPVHVTTAAAAATNAPVSIGFGSISNPMPISSFRMSTSGVNVPIMSSQAPGSIPVMPSSQPPPANTSTAVPMDIIFSSNSSSSSHGEDEDYEDDDEVAGEPSANTSRKRKRGTSSRGRGGSTRRMMEFFEILMKQVMQKQETMQQRFLEVIEKREQDRNIREEAWKRQEMARLTREHELMTQERAISASRDAAIIAFLQKITGQTIQLPPPLNVHNVVPPPPVPPSASVHVTPVSAAPPPPPQQQSVHQVYQHQQQLQTPPAQISRHQIQTSIPPNASANQTEVVMAAPEQQVAHSQEIVAASGGGFEATTSSSRWPKAEVIALIKLRSGLETRYQEAGPKGPLWEEISAGMQRMGYKRNPKRCKEKWENINKYFKKVKESNKVRPEDAKTCPYFHELDALYRKRILGGGASGGGGSSSSLGNQNIQQQPQPAPQQPKLDSATQGPVTNAPQTQGTAAPTDQSVSQSGDHSPNLQKNLFGDAPEEAAKKPEDLVKELMGQQQQHNHQQQVLKQQGLQQQLVVEDYDRVDEGDSDLNLDQDEEDEDDEEDEELDESRKMDYKIEFQKQQNTGPSSNGGGNGAASFLAMVQ